jgi:hypothetical protein
VIKYQKKLPRKRVAPLAYQAAPQFQSLFRAGLVLDTLEAARFDISDFFFVLVIKVMG